jgi:hypothetical protein
LTAPTPSRLDRLEAMHEIGQLAVRYALAVDLRDRTLLEALWAVPPGPVPPPTMNLLTVHEQWRTWFAKGPTVHVVANHVIDMDGETSARGTVYCLAQLDLRTRFVDRTLAYRDTYVREDGRWLFATRERLAWFGQARPANPIEQPLLGDPDPYVGRGTLPRDLMATADEIFLMGP